MKKISKAKYDKIQKRNLHVDVRMDGNKSITSFYSGHGIENMKIVAKDEYNRETKSHTYFSC